MNKISYSTNTVSLVQVAAVCILIFFLTFSLFASNSEWAYLSVSNSTGNWDPWWWKILSIVGASMLAVLVALITQRLLHNNSLIRDERDRKLKAILEMGELVQACMERTAEATRDFYKNRDKAIELDALKMQLLSKCLFHGLDNKHVHGLLSESIKKLSEQIKITKAYVDATKNPVLEDDYFEALTEVIKNSATFSLSHYFAFLSLEYRKVKKGDYDDK